MSAARAARWAALLACAVGVVLLLSIVLSDARSARELTIAPVGAWCWFADPRAVEYGDGVVFGWVADDGSIVVGDDAGRRFTLHALLQRDDHNNPAFHVRDDGRLTAFWSAHIGEQLYYRTTTVAGSIEDWGPVRTAPANPPGLYPLYTYPNPVDIGESLYLFWSGTAGTATFATSSDDGDSWSAARSLFVPEVRRTVRYIKYARDGADIHMAWIVGHPRADGSGIYHAVIRGDEVQRQDGTVIGDLGTPLDPRTGDLVYDPQTDGGAWIHDIEVKDGVPYIVYATFPTVENHTYRYARWDGDAWDDERITAAGPSFNADQVKPEEEYSGGISLEPSDPSTVYLSRLVDDEFEVERWSRDASGWSHRSVTEHSPVPNVRPYPVAGGVAWMRGEYPGFTLFETSIAWLSQVPAGSPVTP